MRPRALAAGMCLMALTAFATPKSPATGELADLPDKQSPEAAIYRGAIVFNNYCALCHGAKADGNGRAARLYSPRPANLVLSDKNDEYKELIIRRGGAALARSEYMPPWDKELSNEQIGDVVAYLRSIRHEPTAAGK